MRSRFKSKIASDPPAFLLYNFDYSVSIQHTVDLHCSTRGLVLCVNLVCAVERNALDAESLPFGSSWSLFCTFCRPMVAVVAKTLVLPYVLTAGVIFYASSGV